jgi:hypothetical protein
VHPDTEKLLEELRKVPAFRAQEIAARHKGINVDLHIARLLESIDETIRTLGRLHLVSHPNMNRIPYAVFLLFNPETSLHDVSVQVGNAAILAMKTTAVAQIMGGELSRASTTGNRHPRKGPGWEEHEEQLFKDQKPK